MPRRSSRRDEDYEDDNDDDLDDHEAPDAVDQDEDGGDEGDDATIECVHCGTHVYEFADRCPKCGEYAFEGSPRRTNHPGWVIAVAVALLVALLIYEVGRLVF